jgi:hypothetical protein
MHTAVTKGGLCEECAALGDEPAVRIEPPVSRPVSSGRLRSPVGLSYALVVLFWVWAVSDLVALAGRRWGPDVLFDLGSGVEGLVWIACALTFLTWFYRVRDNAEVFVPGSQSKGRRWAFWGWMVPVVNFWFPRRIAVDAWVARTQRLPDGSAPPPSYRIINLWWALWLLSSVTDYLPDAVDSGPLLALCAVVDVASAVTAALFVRQLTCRQDVLAQQGPVAVAA